MDFQAVPPPQQYGAPQVFGGQQPTQGMPGAAAAGSQSTQGGQIAAALQKAKQLLGSGQISSDQYSQLATQLQGMGGNMGAGMPQPAGQAAGSPLNIMPGAGG
jgi:hypothetical protein